MPRNKPNTDKKPVRRHRGRQTKRDPLAERHAPSRMDDRANAPREVALPNRPERNFERDIPETQPGALVIVQGVLNDMPEGGYPKGYSPQRGIAVCSLISVYHRGMHWLHEQYPDIVPDTTTITRWRRKHAEFDRMMELAQRERADFLMEDAIVIADTVQPDREGGIGSARVQKAKLQIEARQTLAKSLNPKKYGASMNLELGDDTKKSLAALVADANAADREEKTVEGEVVESG